MRYRRRKTLFPGAKLNISKSGLSTTLGIPGASINIGKGGKFLNTGIPGTGLYNRKRIGGKRSSSGGRRKGASTEPKEELLNKEWMRTEEVESITTPGLENIRDTLLNCFVEKKSLEKAIKKEKRNLLLHRVVLVFSYLLIIGFLFKWFRQNVRDSKENLKELEEQLIDCRINMTFEIEEEGQRIYEDLIKSFKGLLTSDKVWDITAIEVTSHPRRQNKVVRTMIKKSVSIEYSDFEIIKSAYKAFHFTDAQGGNLYFYPGFVAVVNKDKNLGIVHLKDLDFTFEKVEIPYTETIPPDSQIVGSTWARANKDGSRDKRFRENYEIPIVCFGRMLLKNSQGLNEAFLFSSLEKSENFAQKFLRFKNMLV